MPDAIRALLDLGLCCPYCRGDLTPDVRDGEGTLHCGGCARDFPVILGIPDLRTFADPYIEIEPDRAKGQRLRAEGGRTWEDLVRFYYSITLDTVPAPQAAQFAAGLLAAQARAEAALASWDQLAGRGEPARRLLEIGCGTAPLLAASTGRAAVRVGVDIAFRWLVVGQQRLADAGVEAPLVCACAETLPFKAGAFDLVMAQGTLENVRDPAQAVAEAHRVLEAGGQLRVSTANRFSLGPDPHLGIPLGGLVPARAASAYARRRGALPPQRHLLSLAGLARLLRRSGFDARRYDVPPATVAQRNAPRPVLRAAAALYDVARALPVSRQLLFLVGPTLLATAAKPRSGA